MPPLTFCHLPPEIGTGEKPFLLFQPKPWRFLVLLPLPSRCLSYGPSKAIYVDTMEAIGHGTREGGGSGDPLIH